MEILVSYHELLYSELVASVRLVLIIEVKKYTGSWICSN